LKRFPEYLVTVWIILTINFLLPRMVPGDPLLYLSGEAGGDTAVSLDEETRQKLKKYYGLDRPLWQQYVHYLKGICRADLGYSLYFKKPVSLLICKTLPWTLALVIPAILFSAFAGMILGTWAAWQRGRMPDRLMLLSVTLTAAVPSFLLAVFMQMMFAIRLEWFPVSGAMDFYQNYGSMWEKIRDVSGHWVLPFACLSGVMIPEKCLLVRNTLLGILGEDYIFTARLRGIPESLLMYRHALPNALLPLFTHVTTRLGLAAGGMIFIESIFSYPGMGELMHRAVMTHDYPLAQGIFLLITLTVLTLNYLADLLYPCLHPLAEAGR
jgi:peptide/nickel transport system permease protein